MAYNLECPNCESRAWCGQAEMFARLQRLGMLRRVEHPEWEELVELFEASASRLTCAACQHVGLRVFRADATDSDADSDRWDDDWPQVRTCEVCRKPIPAERLEIFPEATRCAQCVDQPNETAEEQDFCPRCGALVSLRQTNRSGITQYQIACRQCGWRAGR